MKILITIIDYRTGNVGSIINMLKKIGSKGIISSDPVDILNAEKLILPGVGSFDEGMKNLKDSGLIPHIEEKVLVKKTPILGICLGMQLLSKRSEEGKSTGLGWVDAEVIKFRFNDKKRKIPHMGWNTISVSKQDDLLNDMPDPSRFYFVHSYHFKCNDEQDILTKTHYVHEFTSAIRKGNIIGVQFHPEKSHKYGMKLMKNFSQL